VRSTEPLIPVLPGVDVGLKDQLEEAGVSPDVSLCLLACYIACAHYDYLPLSFIAGGGNLHVFI